MQNLLGINGMFHILDVWDKKVVSTQLKHTAFFLSHFWRNKQLIGGK